MPIKVLTDFHHSSLLRATNLLFGDRLGMQVYRPIGMEWFDEGFWAINDQRDTAAQFLDYDSQPRDRTPALNNGSPIRDGVFWIQDPGHSSRHRACTLDFFKHNEFQYIIASIPAHVPIFERLIQEFSPSTKLIIQVGNNWDLTPYVGKNVLASTAPHFAPGVNVQFYHQEIDPTFKPSPVPPTKFISSYVNILQNTGQGWADFVDLEKSLKQWGFVFSSFGGQCRDGNKNGPKELYDSMSEAQFILHSKPGGDGFGHIIFSAYASGRPVIARPSQYRGQLAEQLLVPGTFIDLDVHGRNGVAQIILNLSTKPEVVSEMGERAAKRFAEVVDYDKEAKEIAEWIEAL